MDKEVLIMKDRCTSALLAAMELLQEECAGQKGVYKGVGDGVLVFVPEDFIKEFEAKTGHKFGNPLAYGTQEFEKALEVCVKESEWADKLARRMLGEDAPPEALEALKRKLCERLLS